MIARARKGMSTKGPASLYAREWEHTVPLQNGVPAQYDLTVMQFNLLAEGLSAPPSDIKSPPFPPTRDSSYGGFDKLPHPEVILDWELRKWRLLEAIFDVRPDILAIQECDHYTDFFSRALSIVGYEGEFCAKLDSPCLQFGYFSDGVAILFKSEAFQCVWHLKGQLLNGGAYVIVQLVQKSTGKDMLVATCHLKAKENLAHENRRVQQINELLLLVQKNVHRCKSKQIIIAGDFNADSNDIQPKVCARSLKCLSIVT